MRYLSVCSGIEAATVAWHPLGWTPFAFSQFDPDHDYKNGPDFPSALLAFRYPHVPNLGDMTKFREWPDAAIDVLVGGTPCQSFSVAGLRKGLADPRGNLALTFLAIADRYRPEWIVWENVPGVLSSLSHDAPDIRPPQAPVDMERDGQEVESDDHYDAEELHALNSILAGFSGFGWSLRVLDAQYVRVDGFGRAVPQRRRRVIVVGNSCDWRRAAAVLFEPDSLSWNSPPRREAGQRAAPTIASRPTGGGGLGTDFDCDGGLIAGTLGTRSADHPSGVKSESDFLIAHAIQAGALRENPNAGPNGVGVQDGIAYTLEARAEVQAVAFGGNNTAGPIDVSTALQAHAGPAGQDFASETFVAHPLLAKSNSSHDDSMETYVAHALRAEGFDASEDGTGRQNIIPIDMRQASRGATFTNNRQDGSSGGAPGTGIGNPGDPDGPMFTLNSNDHHGVMHGWAVRRLMPIECERLQGFPDNYTLIKFRGKPASDGPRYKSLGNSMAVNVMRWLGRRIDMVNAMAKP